MTITDEDMMERMHRDDIRELARLFRAWEAALKKESDGSAYKVTNALEDRMMHRIERLSIMQPDLPQHCSPDSERAIYTIQEMEGGAWGVCGWGRMLIVEPLLEEKRWHVKTITGYHDEYDEEFGFTKSVPDTEQHFFSHFRAALTFATRHIGEQGPINEDGQ